MTPIVASRNPAALSVAVAASAYVAATAGGSGDNTAVTGLTIDRNTYGVALSGIFALNYEAVLAAAATLSLKTITIEHSSDNFASDTTVLTTLTDPGVIDTGGAGGTTQRGVWRYEADLKSAKRYVRMKFTPDLSAANTDTLKAQLTCSLHGWDRLPATSGGPA